MVNICLLFGIFPCLLKSEVEQNSKGAIQYAADTLQKSIIAGITGIYSNVSIVNLPFCLHTRISIKKYLHLLVILL